MKTEITRLYKVVRAANTIKASTAIEVARNWVESGIDTSRIK